MQRRQLLQGFVAGVSGLLLPKVVQAARGNAIYRVSVGRWEHPTGSSLSVQPEPAELTKWTEVTTLVEDRSAPLFRICRELRSPTGRVVQSELIGEARMLLSEPIAISRGVPAFLRGVERVYPLTDRLSEMIHYVQADRVLDISSCDVRFLRPGERQRRAQVQVPKEQPDILVTFTSFLVSTLGTSSLALQWADGERSIINLPSLPGLR